MINWLHRYIFRGIGFALVTGMITALYLAYVHIQQHGR